MNTRALPRFDITAFGAVPDGVTDCTLAIQKCIDAAGAESGDVLIPRGVYHVTQIKAEAAGVRIIGDDGAVLRSLGGSGFNSTVYLGADRTAVVNIEVDGNYPMVTPAGLGYGVHVGAFDDILVDGVYVHHTKGNGIVTASGGERCTIRRVRVASTGLDGINLSGDEQVVENFEISDWNMTAGTGARAIQVDPSQEADAESVTIRHGVIYHTSDSLDYVDCILIDPGDGDRATGQWITFGNGGAATEDGSNAFGSHGRAKFAIDAGHGFLPGDMLWIANGTVYTNYNNLAHVIYAVGGVGNVFARRVDANTISLHRTSLDARGPNWTGTSQAVGATSITLDAGASATNDVYNGLTVEITNGAAQGSRGTISDYDGSTKVATVTGGWSGATPTGTPTFEVAPPIRLTSTGVGTFYVNTCGIGAKSITVIASDSTVHIDNHTITCTGHKFRTGAMARLTRHNAATDSLPGGLAAAGTVTLNTEFGGAGSGIQYRQPNRIRQVTISDVQYTHGDANNADTNAIKCNNVENLLIERFIENQRPNVGLNEFKAIRLGQNNRKVVIRDCRCDGSLMVNAATWVPDLMIDSCEFGTGSYVPAVAIERIGASRFTLRNSTLRFRTYGLNGPTGNGTEFEDHNVVRWDIHYNVFEGYNPARVQMLDFQETADIASSGLVSFYGNLRHNLHPDYPGLAISSVNTSTDIVTMSAHHQLKTGDRVQLRTKGSAPGGTTADAWYYVRKQGNTTLTLHATEAEASADTRVNITSSGSSSTLWAPEIGVLYSDNGFRDYALFQPGADLRQTVNNAAPSALTWKLGDIVWNMNPASGQPVGWVCTSPGTPGTWTVIATLP